MKYVLLATALVVGSIALALDGQVGIHDPSTIALCNGKFYTYGTGGNALVSDDGWTWRRGTTLPRRGLAPDVIHIGDRYYVYVAANIGAQPKAAINMIWSKTLDPDSPDYKWEEGGVVASSDGVGVFHAIGRGDHATFFPLVVGRIGVQGFAPDHVDRGFGLGADVCGHIDVVAVADVNDIGCQSAARERGPAPPRPAVIGDQSVAARAVGVELTVAQGDGGGVVNPDLAVERQGDRTHNQSCCQK